MRSRNNWIWILLFICNTACLAMEPAPKVEEATQTQTALNTQEQQRIRDLIEQLALVETPNLTIYPDDIPPEKIDACRAALASLLDIGYPAFPQLVAALHDTRLSAGNRATTHDTVGSVCYDILRAHLFLFPEGYRGSLMRTGTDGKLHHRPYWSAPVLFTQETIADWLAQRKDKTLFELQQEALLGYIEAEKKIGFATKEEEDVVLAPLIKFYNERAAQAIGEE